MILEDMMFLFMNYIYIQKNKWLGQSMIYISPIPRFFDSFLQLEILFDKLGI